MIIPLIEMRVPQMKAWIELVSDTLLGVALLIAAMPLRFLLVNAALRNQAKLRMESLQGLLDYMEGGCDPSAEPEPNTENKSSKPLGEKESVFIFR